eukprot:CAMPEP_0117497624 /NCGR_PEP_ID=MMETSP0784-20121206/21279_1 /TAXON_ID=39447 /ORGANISM="" /LENGTH=190 /DNA_ID=CAMNT_0005292653 /DNA_START=102 /DNA_END=674 /DNA_ORIENTATION=+
MTRLALGFFAATVLGTAAASESTVGAVTDAGAADASSAPTSLFTTPQVGQVLAASMEQHQEKRHRRWCGPSICFSEEGSHCFDEHPAAYCMKAIYVCMNYMIKGCEQPPLALGVRFAENDLRNETLAAALPSMEDVGTNSLANGFVIVAAIAAVSAAGSFAGGAVTGFNRHAGLSDGAWSASGPKAPLLG